MERTILNQEDIVGFGKLINDLAQPFRTRWIVNREFRSWAFFAKARKSDKRYRNIRKKEEGER